ncbi:MAG: EAL domain-containing protein [Rhodocyclaceae bacterium]|nr:EAL domain-containing protein [Rhodocyclaceae bacterium]
MPPTARTHTPFLSLKWKVVAALATAMTAISVCGALFYYVRLNDQFELERAHARERYRQEMHGLLAQTKERLQQLASILPALPGVRAPLARGDADAFRQQFDALWPSLQLDMALEEAAYLNTAGKLLAQWGGSGKPELPAALTERLRKGTLEAPVSYLHCGDECRLFALAPVLAEGRTAGAFLVSTSIAELVVAFNRVSGADLAVLAAGERVAAARSLPNWGLAVRGATNTNRMLPVLAAAEGDPRNPAGAPLRSLLEAREYQLSAIPLASLDTGRSPILIAIEDVTEARDRVHGMTKRLLWAALAASVFCAAALYLMLSQPLRRLTHTADTIPLLGNQAFAELRRAILPRRRLFPPDEIDRVDQTALDLSYRLEDLERQVEERTRALADALQQISREKDFLRGLLDSAPVMIVTRNAADQVLSINRCAEHVSGFTEAELRGRPFAECMIHAVGGLPFGSALATTDGVPAEATLLARDGSTREIAWSHSHIAGGGPDDPALLSVGLDISERKRFELRIAYLADHDALTGLINRRRFQQELESRLAAARRFNRNGTLLFLDLDNFKHVNDTSGHQAGDNLLRLVADTLTGLVRGIDVTARLGGDEFALLLEQTADEGAQEVARKVNHRLSALALHGPAGKHRASASIGIVQYPRDGSTVKELLANADIAMYQAKNHGRACWHIFTGEEAVGERLRNWVYWEEHIKQALEQDRCVLHFQPILELAGGRIIHHEALLRLPLEDGRIAMPGEFMDVAERGGLVRELDRSVARHAIRRLARSGEEHMLAVNLSGLSIGDETFISMLRAELAASGVAPGRLMFEITETAAVADFQAARQFMADVQAIGCRFALDDFGAGHASFYYLKQLPVDLIKIDGIFVRGLASNPDDRIFVKAIVDVARGFGKRTVAEFVENAETLELVKSYGVDFAQGNYIGPARAEPALRPQYLAATPT